MLIRKTDMRNDYVLEDIPGKPDVISNEKVTIAESL